VREPNRDRPCLSRRAPVHHDRRHAVTAHAHKKTHAARRDAPPPCRRGAHTKRELNCKRTRDASGAPTLVQPHTRIIARESAPFEARVAWTTQPEENESTGLPEVNRCFQEGKEAPSSALMMANQVRRGSLPRLAPATAHPDHARSVTRTQQENQEFFALGQTTHLEVIAGWVPRCPSSGRLPILTGRRRWADPWHDGCSVKPRTPGDACHSARDAQRSRRDAPLELKARTIRQLIFSILPILTGARE
jgi:hypothetical protein